MTFTATQRASRPEVTRRRDARSRILDAVYGPSVESRRAGGTWYGLRNSSQRSPIHERLAVVREYYEEANWPEWQLAIVLADAGLSYGDLR